MFTSLDQLPLNVPQLETRRALIILNLQNDAISLSGGLAITKPPDLTDKIKALVPHFRNTGDIVWVRTEYVPDKPVDPPPSLYADVEEDSSPELQHASDNALDDEQDNADPEAGPSQPTELTTSYPSSRAKDAMRRASAKARAEKREAYYAAVDELEPTELYLEKPRKGQPPLCFQPGTYGAAIADDVLQFVDDARDLVIIKSHYSALDDTPLLLSLRMKLVTDLYLCGSLSNVSIYATAADAVKHGFSVTVVEDCIGYRSEANHEAALRQMEDIMGAYGITSEELIAEISGTASPDADEPTSGGRGLQDIGLQSMSLENQSPISDDAASTQSRPYPTTEGSVVKAEALAERKAVRQGKLAQRPDAVNHRKSATAAPGILAPNASSLADTRDNPEEDVAGLGSGKSSDGLYDDSTMLLGPKHAKSSHRLSLGSNLRMPTLGPKDMIGEGDSRIILDMLPPRLIDNAFSLMKNEVQWKSMHHRMGEVPRLVAVQGKVDEDGSIPLYRHPADESPSLSPFSPLVEKIRVEVQKILDQPMNHALIQLYRSGEDNISEHSDKTLDIVRGSIVVNVSLGAQRVMTLRTKKTEHARDTEGPSTRQVQRIAMPNNSMFVLGPRTNMRWLHGVRADKRLPTEKSAEERAFGGERISLTFRHIGTFMNPKDRTIWGQGARSKSRSTAHKIVHTDSTEADSMILAFGKENHQPSFSWSASYGHGFDAIDLLPTPALPILYLCASSIPNTRVQLSLRERGIPFETVPPTRQPSRAHHRAPDLANTQHPRFKDTDQDASELDGDLAILSHLEKLHPSAVPPPAPVISRAMHSDKLLALWRRIQVPSSSSFSSSSRNTTTNTTKKNPSSPIQEFRAELGIWEDFATGAEFIAGDYFTVVDCAFWPVLDEIVAQWEGWSEEGWPGLAAYHRRVWGRESVRRVVGDV